MVRSHRPISDNKVGREAANVTWAASKPPSNKGWAQRNTQAAIELLRARRLSKESRWGREVESDGLRVPDTSRRCPACASDPDVTDLSIHDHCYRVVCACPCYWDRRIRDLKQGMMSGKEELEDEAEEPIHRGSSVDRIAG